MLAGMDEYLRIPGIVASSSRASQALSQGRSVFALTGPTIDPRRWASLVRLDPSLRDFVPVEVAAEPACPPVDLAGAALGIRCDRVLVDDSVACSDWQYLVVEGLDDLPRADVTAWAGFARRWAAASHARRSRGPCLPPLFVTARSLADVGPPPGDLLLETHAVHRAISELDVRVLVRARTGDRLEVEDHWREHVLPPLVGNDLPLLDALWQPCLAELSTFEEAARAVAAARGWQGGGPFGPVGAADETAGRAHFTPERGLEWNVCWALHDGRHGFSRRLWRGQTGLLLPLVDAIRLHVAERLEAALGPGWAVRYAAASDEECALAARSHLHAQLGHLCQVVRDAPLSPPLRRDLLPLVALTREVRNELAHYRPITFGTYRRVERAARDAGFRGFGAVM
jgi:hypothetical protein